MPSLYSDLGSCTLLGHYYFIYLFCLHSPTGSFDCHLLTFLLHTSALHTHTPLLLLMLDKAAIHVHIYTFPCFSALYWVLSSVPWIFSCHLFTHASTAFTSLHYGLSLICCMGSSVCIYFAAFPYKFSYRLHVHFFPSQVPASSYTHTFATCLSLSLLVLLFCSGFFFSLHTAFTHHSMLSFSVQPLLPNNVGPHLFTGFTITPGHLAILLICGFTGSLGSHGFAHTHTCTGSVWVGFCISCHHFILSFVLFNFTGSTLPVTVVHAFACPLVLLPHTHAYALLPLRVSPMYRLALS